jgi:hypothetical protein
VRGTQIRNKRETLSKKLKIMKNSTKLSTDDFCHVMIELSLNNTASYKGGNQA